MALTGRILTAPPLDDPQNVALIVDQKGRPLYSLPTFLRPAGHVFDVAGTSPHSAMQSVHLIQLTRFIQQLADFTRVAEELFQDLTAAARKTGDRLQTIEGRISALQSIMPLVDAKMKANFDASQLGVQRQDWRLGAHVDQQLFLKDSMTLPLRNVYRACFEPPKLSQLDRFREDGQACMKFYSYPQFFVEQWRLLMEKEQEERKRKRKGKKNPTLRRRNTISRQTEEAAQKIAEVRLPKTTEEPEEATQTPRLADAKVPSTMAAKAAPSSAAQIVSSHSKINHASSKALDVSTINTRPLSSAPIQRDSSKASLASLGVAPSKAPVPALNPINASAPAGNASLSRTAPPPPAPPPPPMTPGGVSPSAETVTSPPPVESPHSITATAISSAASALKRRSDVAPEPKQPDARSAMLNTIRGGAFQLRKVQAQARQATKKPATNDVASILQRRIALEASDESDGNDEGEDDDWK